MAPVRIHPDNPKLFEYNSKPLVLLTATEHYGAVLNRPFRIDHYLNEAANNGMTLTRLFTLFRELQSPLNPSSTCKPASPDYIAPFARTGPGFALDREQRFNLDKDDPEFYERLHRFIGLAGELGIVVEVVLLSNTYGEPVWQLNPLHPLNNVNNMPECTAAEYLSMRHLALFERQRMHVKRIVTETRQYDNIIYEICNEPGGFATTVKGPTPAEVNDWLSTLISEVRCSDYEGTDRHLIAGQEAYIDKPFLQTLDLSYDSMDYDVVNVHPLPATLLRNTEYHLGEFMSKQLRLSAFRNMTLAAYQESKPLNHDEDNVASQYRDSDGWTIHRKRAWIALLSGAHYDMIDFSIQPFLEEGTPEAQRYLRSWLHHLSEYIHSLDLIHSRPLTEILHSDPPHTIAVAFGVAGKEYSIYVADSQEYPDIRNDDVPEVYQRGRSAGEPISSVVELDLPATTLRIETFTPTTGQYGESKIIYGGLGTHIELAPFEHDTAIHLTVTT